MLTHYFDRKNFYTQGTSLYCIDCYNKYNTINFLLLVTIDSEFTNAHICKSQIIFRTLFKVRPFKLKMQRNKSEQQLTMGLKSTSVTFHVSRISKNGACPSAWNLNGYGITWTAFGCTKFALLARTFPAFVISTLTFSKM